MNPLLTETPMIQKFKQAKQLLQGLKNPHSLLMNNPGMTQVNQLIQQYGSPEQAFRQTAQNMGLNPDELMNMLN